MLRQEGVLERRTLAVKPISEVAEVRRLTKRVQNRNIIHDKMQDYIDICIRM